MSKKNYDNHNRWRNKTVAFRVSAEEYLQLETMVKLTGLTKQDYIIRRLLERDVVSYRYMVNVRSRLPNACTIKTESAKLIMNSIPVPAGGRRTITPCVWIAARSVSTDA